MAHVLILREAPSFVQGEGLIYGTHEQLEFAINERHYEFNGARKGYNIPSGSEVKLCNYRIKKECIPDFLRDLGISNLNPRTLPKGFVWSFCPKWIRKIFKKKGVTQNHTEVGVGQLFMWITLFFKYFTPLKSYDATLGVPEAPLKDGKWAYNYFIGVIPDWDRGMGEEL